METNVTITATQISQEQQNEINNELAIIPMADRDEIQAVAKPSDLLLIAEQKKKISTFKRRFPAKNFVITPETKYDKDILAKATDQWREIKNWRTKEAEPAIKKLKDPYVKLTKFYNDTFNPLIADVKAIEKPISDFIDHLEKLKEEEDKREEREKQQRTSTRVQQLIDAGMVFDGAYYSVGSEEFGVDTISLGMVHVESLPDDTWDKTISEVKLKSSIVAAKQKEKEEKAAKDEEERLAKIEEDKKIIEKQKQQIREQNARLRSKELKLIGFIYDEGAKVYFLHPVTITLTQLEELDDDTWDNLISDAEKRIDNEKNKAAIKQRLLTRESNLLGIGFNKIPHGFIFSYKSESMLINDDGISNASDDEWIKLFDSAAEFVKQQSIIKEEDDRIAEKQNTLSKERETTLAPYWQFVTDTEKKTLGQLNDESFELLLSSKKTASENYAEEKRKEKELEQEKELAKLDDIGKYKDYISKLRAVPVPELKTPEIKLTIDKILSLLSII